MKASHRVLISIVAILGLTYLISACFDNTQANKNQPTFRREKIQPKTHQNQITKTQNPATQEGQSAALAASETPTELASLMKSLVRKDLTLRSFVKDLRKKGLKVIVTFDRQEGLEDMTIVRTQNSLQGVRYLHAQFVGQTGESQPQLRNFSFESPKGPNALNNAATVLKSVFQFTEKDRLDDFDHRMIVYRADDYLCYVSELNTDYMVNHPFNAYDLTEDVGVIRWACDKDVHPHHSESH